MTAKDFAKMKHIEFKKHLAISRDGVDPLLSMLRGQPGDRCTAQDALRHPWINRRSCLLRESLSSPHYGSSLKAFCEKRKRASSYANLDMTPVARALGALSQLQHRRHRHGGACALVDVVGALPRHDQQGEHHRPYEHDRQAGTRRTDGTRRGGWDHGGVGGWMHEYSG